eukprot:5178514-Alexandrium_andersonii.AAC.1
MPKRCRGVDSRPEILMSKDGAGAVAVRLCRPARVDRALRGEKAEIVVMLINADAPFAYVLLVFLLLASKV